MNHSAWFIRLYSLVHCFSCKYETSFSFNLFSYLFCLYYKPVSHVHAFSLLLLLFVNRTGQEFRKWSVRSNFEKKNAHIRRMESENFHKIQLIHGPWLHGISSKFAATAKWTHSQLINVYQKCSGWVMAKNLIALYQQWQALRAQCIAVDRIRKRRVQSRKLAVSFDNNMSSLTLQHWHFNAKPCRTLHIREIVCRSFLMKL